jgi:hypothetical protein
MIIKLDNVFSQKEKTFNNNKDKHLYYFYSTIHNQQILLILTVLTHMLIFHTYNIFNHHNKAQNKHQN